jgi:ABC-type Fe3+-hydroxamate transport system substrate-binding protein
MGEFIAKDQLEPSDFNNFSSQCIGDYHRSLRILNQAKDEEARASDLVRYWSDRVDSAKSYCAKHGVSLYAV